MKIKVFLSLAASFGLFAFALSVFFSVAAISSYSAATAIMLLLIFAQDYLPRVASAQRLYGRQLP